MAKERISRLFSVLPSTDLPDDANQKTPFRKNNPLLVFPKSPVQLPPSRPPKRGVSRSSLNAGRGAVDAAASGAQTSSQGGLSFEARERRDGTPTTDAKPLFVRLRRVGTKPVETLGVGRAAYGQVVWFWHPWLVSSPRRMCRPDRAGPIHQSADDGG
jgi:hypothetical protein